MKLLDTESETKNYKNESPISEPAFVPPSLNKPDPKEVTDTDIEEIPQSFNGEIKTRQKMPPLDDPSVILLSPVSQDRRSDDPQVFQSEEGIETLADEVKHIKEDKAVEFLKEELKDKIVDMIAYQKHNGNDGKVGQGNSSNHFMELRQKQIEAQKDFHKKLLCELEKDPLGKPSTKKKPSSAFLYSF